MSEREFELYLTLLSRFLRLKPEQRREIADELRDHLEARLADLTRAGHSREEAVERALEECGDAAALADHFTQLAQRRRRRFIMRWTMGTIATTTAGILLALAFMPEDRAVEGPQAANAQQPEDEIHFRAEEDQQRDRADSVVEKKLNTTLEEINFEETPLKDVLDQISDQIEADILVDQASLKEYGLTLDTPVTLQLKYTQLPAKTALELILRDRVGDLGFRVRDGFIWISTIDEIRQNLDVRIYNVRDLLAAAEARRAATEQTEDGTMGGGGADGPGMDGGGGFFSVPARSAAATLARTAPTQGGMGGGMGGPQMAYRMQRSSQRSPMGQLIGVIQSSTSGEWEKETGNGGTMSDFDGLLVIRQTQQVHQEIERLLEMLREAAQEDRAQKMIQDRREDDRRGRTDRAGGGPGSAPAGGGNPGAAGPAGSGYGSETPAASRDGSGASTATDPSADRFEPIEPPQNAGPSTTVPKASNPGDRTRNPESGDNE